MKKIFLALIILVSCSEEKVEVVDYGEINTVTVTFPDGGQEVYPVYESKDYYDRRSYHSHSANGIYSSIYIHSTQNWIVNGSSAKASQYGIVLVSKNNNYPFPVGEIMNENNPNWKVLESEMFFAYNGHCYKAHFRNANDFVKIDVIELGSELIPDTGSFNGVEKLVVVKGTFSVMVVYCGSGHPDTAPERGIITGTIHISFK